VATDITEVVNSLDGPERAPWVKMIEAGHIKPRRPVT
jgi:hypothetical protein